MQNTISTLQFEGWGYREMSMAADLLKQYADHGTGSVVGVEPQGAITIGYNPNSGNVYMTDEDFNCYMLNDNGEVEQWVTLPSSGIEDFFSELRSMNDDEIEKLDDEDKAYQQSLTL
jgi:hypothetical protein